MLGNPNVQAASELPFVGDFVWADYNGDGIQDDNEPGMPGIEVSISTLDGKPVNDLFSGPVSPVTTDDTGFYQFKVPMTDSFLKSEPESFRLTFTAPEGYAATWVNGNSVASGTNTVETTINFSIDNDLVDVGFFPTPKLSVKTTDVAGRSAPASSPLQVGADTPSVDLVHTVSNVGVDDLTLTKMDYRVLGDMSGQISKDLNCDFSAVGGPAAGTSFDGKIAPGKSFTCTSQVSNINTTETINELAVTARGFNTGRDISATDQFHAVVPRTVPESVPEEPIAAPVPNLSTPVPPLQATPPVGAGVPATVGTPSTAIATGVEPQAELSSEPELAKTGFDDGLTWLVMGGMLCALGFGVKRFSFRRR
ncbi:SdrD B-like domain-containing protein [Arcanobacterium bovis]|uniref:SD-repeat containing protein B domain-containing protein n=1 Tax=Arcanobacterium bovis TaxID=2529275 RepID=A0A4Q9UYQ9_9ACTO|nr:SdrD B-like domain-containing protein [Arcanobacterium bovis]TBW20840.1 hypothetical protein EZJ44_07895 [Arcanobacterium bovis]